MNTFNFIKHKYKTSYRPEQHRLYVYNESVSFGFLLNPQTYEDIRDLHLHIIVHMGVVFDEIGLHVALMDMVNAGKLPLMETNDAGLQRLNNYLDDQLKRLE